MSRKGSKIEVSHLVGVLFCFAASSATAPHATADPAELVTGVSQITNGGAPGPIYATLGEWWSIAGGDEDASFPSLFVAARDYGAGRVLAVGHDNLITNPGPLDNAVFLVNVMEWLDVAGVGEVRWTTGHAEWVNASAVSGLVAPLGMNVQPLGAPLTLPALASVSVLVVGNAWGGFTSDEIEAVRQWVENGGGLYLAGLGWSWEAYHDEDMSAYPMMQLAAPYGIRWLGSIINDPTDHFAGSAVFHEFYPDIPSTSVGDATALLIARHTTLGNALPDLLEIDAALRLEFTRAHQSLAIPTSELDPADPLRQDVFDAYATLFSMWPGSYARGFSYNEAARPTMTWLRERAWRTWRDVLALTPARKAMIESLGQLSGRRRDIFHEYDLVVLDNDRLGAVELELLYDHLALIPDVLQDLWSISVVDQLGKTSIPVSLAGTNYGVNIFGFSIGEFTENPFPPDVPPYSADVFTSVVAHEMNHVVDATTIGGSPARTLRRDMLIADAGSDAQNYLRSMLPAGFFVANPQEFFASISNQWFADSDRCLELGLVRFDVGRPDPINQVIFFADVYSRGSPTTFFYETDTAGHVTRSSVTLGRNTSGYVTSMWVPPTRYEFEVGPEGRVTAYAVDPCGADVDGTGSVGFADLTLVLASWGECPEPPIHCTPDVNGNGSIGFADVTAILVGWGPCSGS